LVGAHDQRASVRKQDRRGVIHAPDIGFGQDGELISWRSLGVVAENIYKITITQKYKLIDIIVNKIKINLQTELIKSHHLLMQLGWARPPSRL
jgi:hypothetical protein